MGAASYAVPVGVLAAIVVVGLIVVWFWFPHAYRRGLQSDHDTINQAQGADRELQRQANRETIERFKRAKALERGEIVEDHREDGIGLAAPPPAYTATDNKAPSAEVERR